MQKCTWTRKDNWQNAHTSSLVNQTLRSQGAYRLEIISAHSKRVWWTAHTIFVQRIDRFCRLLIGVEVAHRGDDLSNVSSYHATAYHLQSISTCDHRVWFTRLTHKLNALLHCSQGWTIVNETSTPTMEKQCKWDNHQKCTWNRKHNWQNAYTSWMHYLTVSMAE